MCNMLFKIADTLLKEIIELSWRNFQWCIYSHAENRNFMSFTQF